MNTDHYNLYKISPENDHGMVMIKNGRFLTKILVELKKVAKLYLKGGGGVVDICLG